MLLLAVAGSWSGAEAQSTKGKVVGLGAATCQRFKDDVKSNAILRRDYMAWAQGFMSGMLASQPGGADQQIDLNPVTYDLVSQLHFLEDHCSRIRRSAFPTPSRRSSNGYSRKARHDWPKHRNSGQTLDDDPSITFFGGRCSGTKLINLGFFGNRSRR